MTAKYEAESKFRKLATVLDDHAEWYGLAVRRIFYPELQGADAARDMPESFISWLAEVQNEDFLRRSVLQSLRRIHDELHETADRMFVAADPKLKPDPKMFDTFCNLYEGFVTQLRRLEYDAAQADSGIDPMSGLRSREAMVVELKRELERRSRRGRPFGLAVARIDNFDVIRSLSDEPRLLAIMATVGRLILKCIRSFDDGYRSGEAEFVMSLKHADAAGGKAAINRLRAFLEQEKIVIPDGNGGMVPLTMSYCVAEPLPGDTLEDLMNNMRNDLERFKEEGGDLALEYHEQSPLSRLVSLMGEPAKA